MAILFIKDLSSEQLREILKQIKGLQMEVLEGPEGKSDSTGPWEDLEEEESLPLPRPPSIH